MYRYIKYYMFYIIIYLYIYISIDTDVDNLFSSLGQNQKWFRSVKMSFFKENKITCFRVRGFELF